MSPEAKSALGNIAGILGMSYEEVTRPTVVDAAEMDRLASIWRRGDRNEGVSVNMNVAISIVHGFSSDFKDPIGLFLTLPPWLQAWIMTRMKLTRYIGKPLGIE